MAKPLKVGLAGIGTVGTAVAQLLQHQRDTLISRCGRAIEIVAVSARSRSKKRGIDLRKMRWVADLRCACRRSRDRRAGRGHRRCGRSGQTRGGIRVAAGKPVVTANKALLAAHGNKLATLAERHGVALNFEASVAGGIPIVKTLREGLNGNSFTRIYGILNGTCNYILSRMEQDRIAFGDCLREAQRLATPRPTRLSISRVTTPRRSFPSSPVLLSAPKSIPRRSTSRGFPRSRLPISMPRPNSATGSSSLALRCVPKPHRAARASDHGA